MLKYQLLTKERHNKAVSYHYYTRRKYVGFFVVHIYKNLISYALRMRKIMDSIKNKKEVMNMCEYLQEIWDKGYSEGYREGYEIGFRKSYES